MSSLSELMGSRATSARIRESALRMPLTLARIGRGSGLEISVGRENDEDPEHGPVTETRVCKNPYLYL